MPADSPAKDGRIGFAIGNFANEMTALCVSQPTPGGSAHPPLDEGAIGLKLAGPAEVPSKFGIFFSTMISTAVRTSSVSTGTLRRSQQDSERTTPPAAGGNCSGMLGTPVSLRFKAKAAGPDISGPLVGRGAPMRISMEMEIGVVFTQAQAPRCYCGMTRPWGIISFG